MVAIMTVFRSKFTTHKISHNPPLHNTHILTRMMIENNKTNRLIKSIKQNKKELKSNLIKNLKEICL